MNSENATPLAQVLAVIPGLVATTEQMELEEEDIEVLETALRTHAELTGLLTARNLPGYRLVTGVSCPFYANASLRKYARYVESLPPAGVQALAAAVVTEAGSLVLRAPQKLTEMVGGNLSKPKETWEKSLKRLPRTHLMRMNSRELLADCESIVEGPDKMYNAWFEAMVPAVSVGLRGISDKQVNSLLRQFKEALKTPATELLRGLRQEMQGGVNEVLDAEALAIVNSSQVRTLGLYNFVTQPAPEGVDQQLARRNRLQAVQSLGNLTGAFANFHDDNALHDRLRHAVDAGERINDLVCDITGAKASQFKALLRANLSELEGGIAAVDIFWIRDYLAVLEQLPPQRYPAAPGDMAIAGEMRKANDDVQAIGSMMGATTVEIWEGALKQGWSGMVRSLATHADRPHGEELPDDIVAARYAVAVIGEIRRLGELLQKSLEKLMPVGFGSHTPQQALKVLLAGKSLTRLAEYLREWRQVEVAYRAADAHIPAGLPAGCDWHPLLKNKVMPMLDGTITELVRDGDLVEEHKEMGHCVNTYTDACRISGHRIFRISRGEGRPNVPGERGTLNIIISQDCLSFEFNQFYSRGNTRVAPELDAISNRFQERLRNGEIESDFDGFRKDRALQRGARAMALAQQELAEKTKLKIVSEGAVPMMPKPCKGQTLVDFVKSPYLAQELNTLQRREIEMAAKAAAAAPTMG